MKNYPSKSNIIHKIKDNNVISLKNKNGKYLTVCFCQCDCHSSNSNINNAQLRKDINNSNKTSNIKLNSLPRNSFSKNYMNPIGKEFSYDYNNNYTEINQNQNGKLTKEVNNKLFSENITDNNYEKRNDDFMRESLYSVNGYKKFPINLNKNKNKYKNNYSNNEFILYRNDITDFSKFINTLNEIKNREKRIPKCSSLKEFNKFNNNRYYYNNRNDNNFLNYKNNITDYTNSITDNNKIDLYPNLNKSSINIYNNNKLNRSSYNNEMKNKKRSLSMEYEYNDNFLLKSNYSYYNNNDKISQTKKTKIILRNQNQNLGNNLFYNYNNSELNKIRDNFYKKNEINNNLSSYTEEYIKDKYNNDYYNNVQQNSYEINENLNPLGHIVDNFLLMLKDKHNINNNNKLYKKNINTNKIPNSNVSISRYNDNIAKKKKKLNNICLPKTKPRNNSTFYEYRCKNYSSLENKIKKIEINNKKNLIAQNSIKSRMKEYEKKYGKNNNFNNNKKYINSDKYIKSNNHEINVPSLYTNNKIYKFNKYNEENNAKSNDYNLIKNKRNNLIIDENNRYYYIDNNKENFPNNNTDYQIKSENSYIGDNRNINSFNTNNNKSQSIYLNYADSLKDKKTEIKKFDNFENKNKNKNNNKANSSMKNMDNNTKIYELQLSPSKIKKKNNVSRIPISPFIGNNSKNECMISKNNENHIPVTPSPSNNIKKRSEKRDTVSERIRKLINKKAKNNINNLSLSSKLNLDTNLSLSDDNEIVDDNANVIQRNIDISPKTIFTIYHNYENPMILAFDFENKAFSFQDYSDFGNFEKNYKLSMNTKDNNNNLKEGNLYITIDTNLYIITGKNYDMLYMFDSIKKSIIKLCSLHNNHSNGSLLNYENNIICCSGDFNKKVEMFSINKNEWTNLPEMLIERSNSFACIVNNKDNKYLLNIFGFNSQTKEYLNTIEYLILNKKDSFWKLLKFNNPNLLSLNLSNFFCINYFDNKLIIIGGYNGKDNKYNNKFIQFIFDKDNFENNIIVEETERKFKDIDINKKYLFYKGYKNYNDNNEIFYEVFDDEFNCHLFQKSNMAHDVFYFHN